MNKAITMSGGGLPVDALALCRKEFELDSLLRSSESGSAILCVSVWGGGGENERGRGKVTY